MTEFHVEYRIEVEADAPEDAASLVASILANGGAERGVYHVKEHGIEAVETVVDLDRDGCVADGMTRCPNCGEITDEDDMHHWPNLVEPVHMCSGCLHNARRSGWEPGQ